jgi:hypothetical protein
LVAAIVYQIASIPILAALTGAAIGLGIKYMIDRPKWQKKLKAAQNRHQTNPPYRTILVPTAYPDWHQLINFESSAIASNAQVGVSEQQFLNCLQHHFPAAFGHQYPNDWGGKYNYSSDLEIILPDKGIALQIEIDEPYEGKQGKPHHCRDNPKDSQRDRFFLKRDWVIIHFAEEQVVRQPQACCQFIAHHIHQLTGDNRYIIALGESERLISIARWTTKEARQMHKIGHRLKYLIPAGLWNSNGN